MKLRFHRFCRLTYSCGSESDGELLKQWKSDAFELQVGIHELLGHGSGKLFYQEGADGFNFDRELQHPLHEGQGISTWYKPGQTWDGVFGSLSSAYEECRAECTGVFLCDDPLALSIFGHEGEEGRTITYARPHDLLFPHPHCDLPTRLLLTAATSTGFRWRAPACASRCVRPPSCFACNPKFNPLCMCGLEFYTPGKGWRQAHMQGRWAILRLMIECGAVDIIVRADVVASSAVTPCFAVRRSCVIGPGLPPHPLEKGHARRC
jgi:dipeptidyl-peptidase-3